MAHRLQLAFANRRFQLLLLWLTGLPIVASFLARTLVVPVLTLDHSHDDFLDFNLTPAIAMRSGDDPFGPCRTAACFTGSQGTPYPPVVPWALQPVAAVDAALLNSLALVACQLCLAGFLFLVLRNLSTRQWRFRVLAVLLAISWWPVLNDLLERQLQLLVLLCLGVFFDAQVRWRPWAAGAAAGLAAALKLTVAPLLLAALWLRWWRVALAMAGIWVATWLVAPRYLPEYLTSVLPGLSGGTGVARNDAFAGVLTRLLEPATMYAQSAPAPVAVKVAAAAVAAAATLAGAELVRRRPDADPRLKVAVLVAGLPLATTLAWPGHLVILLVPMLVLADLALVGRDLRLAVWVALAWALMGPAQVLLIRLSLDGRTPELLLQVLSDAGFAGIVVLWAAAVATLARAAPSPAPNAV